MIPPRAAASSTLFSSDPLNGSSCVFKYFACSLPATVSFASIVTMRAASAAIPAGRPMLLICFPAQGGLPSYSAAHRAIALSIFPEMITSTLPLPRSSPNRLVNIRRSHFSIRSNMWVKHLFSIRPSGIHGPVLCSRNIGYRPLHGRFP